MDEYGLVGDIVVHIVILYTVFIFPNIYSEGSLRVEGSHSGPVMTQKLWWRYSWLFVDILIGTESSVKVYLPAIEGHVPIDMVHAIWAFLEFCYLTWWEVHETTSIQELQNMLDRFHHYHTILKTTGVHNDFNLPSQHSLLHYPKLILICEYGALNGPCSSITELKHIKAIKEPWRQFNHYKTLGQIS